jgi:TetR/AcrR family transcriptional regulator, transcriptional repressor for nem operon
MARPKSFDEQQVLDAAVDCFRRQGLNSASIRDLADEMGIAGPSLYNAFGCKRSLFLQALERYVDCGMRSHFAELEQAGPKAAIRAFFAEFIDRASAETDPRGCLLVNTAMEIGARDEELAGRITDYLGEMEAFLRRNLQAAQSAGELPAGRDAGELAALLFAHLLGLAVIARVQPDRVALKQRLTPALALLDDPS